MFATDLVLSLRDSGLIIRFTVKLSLKDYNLTVSKLLESYLFFLALEAITIAAVNCKTSFMLESSVRWEIMTQDGGR